MDTTITLTGAERQVRPFEIISTRTDPRGVITFANPAFLAVTGFAQDEVLDKPHNIIRHPDVPRAVYHALWQGIQGGESFFAVTKNRCKNGDHYWTLGYFNPCFPDGSTDIVGYRSTRKGFHSAALKQQFDDLFQEVRKAEQAVPRPEQVKAGLEALAKGLRKRGFGDYQQMSRQALAE